MPLPPLVPFTIGAISEAFVKYGSRSHIRGAEKFHQLLKEAKKNKRGVLTISNHTSMLDDPLIWGAMPMSAFFKEETIRYTLGAADMMFNGRLDSWFFKKGQVIKTVRGAGIYQESIDEAIERLKNNGWIHMFPEGKINQDYNSESEYEPWIRRFKWGISRILLESNTTPYVVPICIRGFDKVMSEEAPFPKRVPRPFQKLEVNFGEPINDKLEPLLSQLKSQLTEEDRLWRPAVYGRGREVDMSEEPSSLSPLRVELAAHLRQMMVDFGKETRVGSIMGIPSQKIPSMNDRVKEQMKEQVLKNSKNIDKIVKETAHIVNDFSNTIKREASARGHSSSTLNHNDRC